MTLALVREWARTGRKPPRDIVLAFVSDEEAGGRQGAHYLVDNHRDLFADCTEAISEVGGFSDLPRRPHPAVPDPDRGEGHQLAAAARRTARPDTARWCIRQRGHAAGRGGARGSGSYEWPVVITDTVRATVDGLAEVTGRDLDPDDVDSWLPMLGSAARMIGATIRNTANPTMLEAGYKANVIPSRPRPRSTPVSCPAGGRVAEDDRRAARRRRRARVDRARHRRRDRIRRRAGRRACAPRCGPRTRARTRCRT